MGLIKLLPISFRNKYRKRWHKLVLKNESKIVEKIRWRLNRQSKPLLVNKEVYLHLGCGNVNHPSFINIDLVAYPHVHYLHRIDDLRMFPDNSVDLIYASHCLEHFSFRHVPAVLSEWERVLKVGGKLRLSVPDFDSIVETYLASGRHMDSVSGAIVGGQDYKYNFHYAVFNHSSLAGLIEQAGFSDVFKWIPGETFLTTFDDYSNKSFKVGEDEYPISLNLEARKSS